MPISTTSTLAERFHFASNNTSGYGTFFQELLNIVRNKAADALLGEQIKTYVLDWLRAHPLDGFDKYSDNSYRRDYIGRCPDTHWEAIVMSWKQGNTTAIHAHPQFAGYHFADGVFKVEIFEPAESSKARLADTITIDKPTGLFSVGRKGSFDNHIHRITCLSGTGHSLHVYSDDALKGLAYEEIG